jgi:uncharacterized protein
VDQPANADPGVLGVGECLALLRSASVGRLVFTRNALPAIRPVNFALHEDELLLWPPDGLPAGHQEIVAFQVDRVGPNGDGNGNGDANGDGDGDGWSVVLIGALGPEPAVPVDALPPRLRARAAGVRGPVLRMHVRHVAGARLRLPGGVTEPA